MGKDKLTKKEEKVIGQIHKILTDNYEDVWDAINITQKVVYTLVVLGDKEAL